MQILSSWWSRSPDRNEGGQGTEMAGEGNVVGGDRGAQHGHGAYHH
jgi:hypothetical protein